MNKHVFASALAVVCVSTVAAWAQSGRSNTSPSATNRFVVIGCVSRAAGTTAAGRGRGAAAAPRFLITDTRGETPTVYQLQGDASQLDLHVGHTMEIAGPLSAPAGAAAGNTQKPNLTLKVESLTWIATKCGK
jgi:hypothetical protein